MSDLETYSVIIGVVMPVIVAVLKQSGWRRRWNLTVAILACLGAGVLNAYITGFSGDILPSTAIIFATAQATYQAWFRDSLALNVIEQRTSFIK